MGRQRTWDFDEGLRLHAAGWSIPRIAVHLGVADANVRRVVDPAYNARCVEATRRSRKSAVCVDCGATIWKRSGSSSGLRKAAA